MSDIGEMRKQILLVADSIRAAATVLLSASNDLREVAEMLQGYVAQPPMLPAKAYSQNDFRWKGDQLGPDPGLTLGAAGCAVTCAAFMCTLSGVTVTPGELNAWLTRNGGFFAIEEGDPRNQLDWTKVVEFADFLQWDGKRVWRKVAADMDEVRRVLRYGPVIAEVDFDKRDPDVDQHFVVLMRFSGEDEIEVMDPWDGVKVGLVERYFNPKWRAPDGKCARVITGLRTLTIEA